MATILLVEDNDMLADCYERWLKAELYKVQRMADAQSALDALDDSIPDVILLDLLLPGANGVQFLQTLRSYPDLAAVPIIVCSNVNLPSAAAFSAYGVKAVLDKATLTRRSLAAAVAGVL